MADRSRSSACGPRRRHRYSAAKGDSGSLPRLFVSTLLHYNSAARNVSVNARLRWEYILGSELLVVYNEQRDTGGAGFQNRSFVGKINRLFRL